MDSFKSLSDEELVLLAKSGDRSARDVLISRCDGLIYSCAKPFFLAWGDENDLLLEAMLGLDRAVARYDASRGALFKTFASKCIRTQILSAIKSASAKKHTPLNDASPLEETLGSESQPARVPAVAFQRSPEDLILARESAEEFFKGFTQTLSKFENQVFALMQEGYAQREMCVALGRDKKSIDNAVQRIRRKLARYINSGDFGES